MSNEDQKQPQRIAWKYSQARDVLVLWSESSESPKRIEVPGVMVRQLTGGVTFDDLPAHKRSYILSELYSRPNAYGGKVVSGG
jgi:hypothetical protein